MSGVESCWTVFAVIQFVKSLDFASAAKANLANTRIQWQQRSNLLVKPSPFVTPSCTRRLAPCKFQCSPKKSSGAWSKFNPLQQTIDELFSTTISFSSRSFLISVRLSSSVDHSNLGGSTPDFECAISVTFPIPVSRDPSCAQVTLSPMS